MDKVKEMGKENEGTRNDRKGMLEIECIEIGRFKGSDRNRERNSKEVTNKGYSKEMTEIKTQRK